MVTTNGEFSVKAEQLQGQGWVATGVITFHEPEGHEPHRILRPGGSREEAEQNVRTEATRWVARNGWNPRDFQISP